LQVADTIKPDVVVSSDEYLLLQMMCYFTVGTFSAAMIQSPLGNYRKSVCQTKVNGL